MVSFILNDVVSEIINFIKDIIPCVLGRAYQLQCISLEEIDKEAIRVDLSCCNREIGVLAMNYCRKFGFHLNKNLSTLFVTSPGCSCEVVATEVEDASVVFLFALSDNNRFKMRNSSQNSIMCRLLISMKNMPF